MGRLEGVGCLDIVGRLSGGCGNTPFCEQAVYRVCLDDVERLSGWHWKVVCMVWETCWMLYGGYASIFVKCEEVIQRLWRGCSDFVVRLFVECGEAV